MATKKYDLISKNSDSTVVCEYALPYKKDKFYQSEDDLEKAFIKQLESQEYEYLNIACENDLILNLRKQISILNNYEFTDNEWNHFFKTEIANSNSDIVEKTQTIQKDSIKILKRDDGSEKNIYLLRRDRGKDSVHDNILQVINQYRAEGGRRKNRYDVTVLVNGLPLIHIELKKRGVDIKEAFNQVERYQRDSFWESSGLFEYVQLFVISNGTHTKYYSNTTRFKHLDANKNKKGKKSSDSFEFTNWWADSNNKAIPDLMDFTRTFFAKHTILNVLTKYCIFTAENDLLVMRPYQIVAAERIISRVKTATAYKQIGSLEAGGYIWHTTGSGKTLTSFKAAQLATEIESIEKVLFVVDRKDLDYQTMKEYDKFEKGAANTSQSTNQLKSNLEDPSKRIGITTIQKLDRFIQKNKGHKIFGQHVVLIFDECHRSQFGDMHSRITKSFKKYHLFGFTGTPIFAQNSSSSGRIDLKTTDQAFGEKLHAYTIVNAINDGNVLPFRTDYISTMRKKKEIKDKKISDIDRKKALESPVRIKNNVKYIIDNFDAKTKRNEYYNLKGKRANGFNSIFAVSSIEMAMKYYAEFKKQFRDCPENKKLKVATIYSFGANEEETDGIFDENNEDTSGLDATSRDFLDNSIKDYNKMFGLSYDTSSEGFQGYYKDVSEKMKNRELDLLIVVNMFLTGFDATTLNTLWVDKNLKMHGLLQAFSRTNRILNAVKCFGNIICFRNLEKVTNESISLFGDKDACGVVLLKKYEEYYNGYEKNGKMVKGYFELVNELNDKFEVGEIIQGEGAQKEFITLYNAILKVENILSVFDEFKGNKILSDRELMDYQSEYHRIAREFRKKKDNEKENINDDLVFEMELIKQVDINIDYILNLVNKYHDDNTKDKEILSDINRAIASSMQLRNKKELIEEFIATLDSKSQIDEEWVNFVSIKKIEQLERIIRDENLKIDETKEFMDDAFRDGYMYTSGSSFSRVLPPVSRFLEDDTRAKKREAVIDKFRDFFNKFYDISNRL